MRLFIACPVTTDIAKYLSELQSGMPDAKLILSKAFHLTLKFLGDVDGSKLDVIKERLQQIKFTTFNVSLAPIGVFPVKGLPRVVWVGLEPADKIHAVQQQVETALQDLFSAGGRFHPHLTLARVKHSKPGFVAGLKTLDVEAKSFPIDSVILFKSELAATGPVYTELLKVPAV